MDMIQYITLLATMIGGIYGFYQITKQEIGVIREQITLMNTHHREDIIAINDRMEKMDKKWESLFERLFFKENTPVDGKK